MPPSMDRCQRWLVLLPAIGAALGCFPAQGEVTLKDDGRGTVRVEINGGLFTEYHYAGERRPYLYPIIGPGGDGMTRNFPMKKVDGEETDHPHHRGLWYGHHQVNNVVFWGDSAKATSRLGKIQHERFTELRGGKDGLLRARNRWVADDGELILTEERELIFRDGKDARMVDFNITLTAPAVHDVVFADNKDGAMAIRVAESIRVERPKVKGQKKAELGDGHLVTSRGKRDLEAWGTRAEWVDYFGPLNGKTAGVAIFDHPSNPRHPSWWHARGYGLFAANPFGKAQFENLPGTPADMYTVKAGESVTFRYRFFFHTGDEQQARVAEQYKEYVRQITPENPVVKKSSKNQ